MVSTRQMSSVGGHNGGSDGAGPSQVESASVARVTRHSSTIQPSGFASPQQQMGGPPNKCMSLVPVSKHVYAMQTSKQLLDLPIEIVEKILYCVGFKTISQLRMVNKEFNSICSSVLNSTFYKLQNQMLNRFQSIKAKMPRRESARRSHPLACESDIIETLHMRLSLLQMTLGKHIERKHICFFPGEIIDEVYSILSYLKTTTKLARPYKVTDELFDLTTMAMEYFKEHIEPNLPEITYFGTDFFDMTFSPGESKSYLCLDSPPPSGFEASNSTSSAPHHQSALSYLEESLPPSPPPPQSNMVLRKRIHRIKQGMKKYNDQLSALRSDLRTCKRKTALQQKQIMEQQKQIGEQQKQILEYANRLDDYDKKSEESSRKFQTLLQRLPSTSTAWFTLQELNKCKTELQYWRSRSPAIPPLCADCSMAAAASSQLSQAELVENNEPEVVIEPETAGTSAEQCLGSPESKPVVVQESSGDETTATTPARRRPSSDTATPERKKRRLTRPRKL